MRSTHWGFWALVLSAFLVCVSARAQTAGHAEWQGELHNAGGAPISGAEVELTAKGGKAKAVTGEDGRFQLTALPAGQYHLTVQTNNKKIGFAEPIVLTPASSAVVLTLSARGEITVSQLKQKEQTATGGEELSSQAVSELPLNKRDFSSLLLLAAGTMTDSQRRHQLHRAVRHQRAARR